MKTNLLKKLSACLHRFRCSFSGAKPKGMAFIVTAMLFSASANAQIVYTDINPDTTIIRTRLNQRGNYSIEQSRDFNNDGIPDLKFTLITSIITGWPPLSFGYTAGTIRVTPLNGSAVLTGNAGYPAKLNLNAIVSATANWSTIANQLIFDKKLSNGTTTNTGNWNTATDGFLGLRVIAGGQTHYCWIQLNAAAFTSGANAAILTIKDYAYNSVSNRPILAGETSCTIPTVNLTRIGALSFCNGDSVTFTANGTGYQYQWRKNNANIAGATSQSYVAKTAGTYSCRVTNSCGSKTSAGKVVTVPCRTTDDNGVELGEQLSVYPNPATDQLNLTFPFTEGDAVITVLNSLGQTMLKQNVTSGDEAIQVNVQDLSEGLYFIIVQNGERAFNSRFIKK